MLRNYPICVNVLLVCGVILALYCSDCNAQLSYNAYGGQTGYPGSGYGVSSLGGYTPGFGQDSSFTSYKSVSTHTVTLPDGTTRTEEVIKNSDGTSQGTNTRVNSYGSDTAFGGSSYGSSGYPGSYGSPPTSQGYPSNHMPGFDNRDSSNDCLLPTSMNHGGYFTYNRAGQLERVPSTPGWYSMPGDRVFYECDRGYSVFPPGPVPPSVCTRGQWIPKLPKCYVYRECMRSAECPAGDACVTGRCIDRFDLPPSCRGSCGLNSECGLVDGRYKCVCVYGYRDSDYGCQPTTSLSCSLDRACPQDLFCINGLCLDPCEGYCGVNGYCKRLGSFKFRCSCSNGFVPVNDVCRPISTPECQTNSQCSDDLVCRKQSCVDPCEDLCGNNTLCAVKDHQPTCSCKPGYSGNASVGCQRQVPCPTLTSRNMNVKCKFQDREVSCTRSVMPGTIAIPECKEYFKPDEEPESSQLTCLPSGQWDYPILNCIPDDELCPPLQYKSRNVNVTCMFQDKDVSCDRLVKPGTIAIPKCNNYYKLPREPEYSQLTCLPTGRWDYPLFRCTPECGRSTEIGKPIVNEATPLIIDGKEANVGTFPWHAGLYFRQGESWDQKCGGSLISEQFVLTAAHCVYKQNEGDVRIAMGKYYRAWDRIEDNEQKRNVTKIIYHPDFHLTTLVFDIALLRLDSKIDVGKFVMPVCKKFMDRSADLLIHEKLYIAGWGQTKDVQSGSSSDILLYNDLMLVPQNICRRLIPETISLFDRFCSMKNINPVVSVAQPGDSGGGLTAVLEEVHYIFGIVSNKVKNVTMFTNVTWLTHTTWVEREIRKYDTSFRWNES